jgi:uncharacterized protein YegL
MIDWLKQLELEHPQRLYALLVIPVLFYFSFASIAALPRWRRVASAICRSLLIASVIVAWSGVWHRGPTNETYTIFVTDRSASVDWTSAHVQTGGSSSSEFAFGKQPLQGTEEDSFGDVGQAASDPGAGVLLAAGRFPAGYVPEIFLQSDGNETAGDAFAAAQAANIPIHTRTLPPNPKPEVSVSAVNMLPAPRWVPNNVEVVVTANQAGEGKLLWASFQLYDPSDLRDEHQLRRGRGHRTEWPEHEMSIKVKKGENRFQFTSEMKVSSNTAWTVCRVGLDGFQDTVVDNNVRTAVAYPSLRPRSLFCTDAGQFVAEDSNEEQFRIEEEYPNDALDLYEYECVILQNPTKLTEKNVAAIKEYVCGGGGLIVVGGNETFGYEQFHDTVLEKLMPIRASQEVVASRSTLAMLLVIDKSKSMENDNRMGLAKEAAKQTVDLELLTAQDRLGILAFGNTSEWISPIVPCENKPELKRQIDGLKAEGQTNMFPALQRAYLALSDAPADRRHIILMTDGVPLPGDFDKIAQRMADAGITVSTVSISAGADQSILKDISRIASGRHIHCESAEEIAPKLVAEARSAVDSKREQYPISIYRQLPDLDISKSLPLEDYALTSPKPNAELLLLAGPGDPLLAWWQYGAGKVAAYTSPVNITNLYVEGEFWNRVVKLVRRKARPPQYNLSITRHRSTCRVELDVVGRDGSFANGNDVQMVVMHVIPFKADEAYLVKSHFEPTVMLVAPGRYAGEFEMEQFGTYLIDVHWEDARAPVANVREFDGHRHLRRSISYDFPDEYLLQPTNETLLRNVAAVSGGSYDPDSAQIGAASDRTVERVTALWRCFVFIGMILFVVDVGLRRA